MKFSDRDEQSQKRSKLIGLKKYILGKCLPYVSFRQPRLLEDDLALTRDFSDTNEVNTSIVKREAANNKYALIYRSVKSTVYRAVLDYEYYRTQSFG